MLASVLVSEIRTVKNKVGVSTKSGQPYSIWSVVLDDLDGTDTSPEVNISQEVVSELGLDKDLKKFNGKKCQVYYNLSFTRVGFQSVPRINITSIKPVTGG